MDSHDLEAGVAILPPAPPPPRNNICEYPSSKEVKMESKQNKELAILKIVLGLILTVLYKYWIVSTITFISIIILFWVYGVWLALLLTLLSLTVTLYQISDELVYWPTCPPDSRVFVRLPSSIGLPSENLYLYAKDGTKLHTVFIKQNHNNSDSVPTFIYLHGNAGNMGHRLANVYGMYRYLCVNILLVEYRGYGLSSGSSSERGLYLDAQAAISYLKTRSDIDQNKIVLFGRSLGGAVAIDCVSRSEIGSRIAALVVENTFTSIPDMARVLFTNIQILQKLPYWCHKNKYMSKWKMCRVVLPTLMLSGRADTLVPPQMMVELYRACASPVKRLLQFAHGSHNETWKCSGYHQSIVHFLDEVFHQSTVVPKYPPTVTCISEPQIL